MKLRVFVLIMLFLAGTACCSWFFLSSQNSSMTSDQESFSNRTGILWSDSVPLGKITVLEDGSIIAGNNRGEIIFLAPDKPPKSFPVAKTSISAPVLVHKDICYVGDEGGTFSAFTPSQGLLWSFRAGNQITGAAIPAADLIWFGAHDNSMYALATDGPSQGKLIHEVECQGQINGTPIMDGDCVFFGSCDGKLRKIDIHSGTVLLSIDFESYIPESPVLFDHILYLLTNAGDLAAVNPDSFEIIYRIHTDFSFFSSPFVTDDFIYLTDSNGRIHVHRRKDGTPVCDITSTSVWNPVSCADGDSFYAISKHGHLSRFQVKSWKETVIAELPSDFSSGLTMAQGRFLAPDDYGNLFYVESKDVSL